MSLILTTALEVGSSIFPVLLMGKLVAVPTSPGTAKAKASSRFFWSTISDLSSARPLSHCSYCLATAYAINISFLSQRLAISKPVLPFSLSKLPGITHNNL